MKKINHSLLRFIALLMLVSGGAHAINAENSSATEGHSEKVVKSPKNKKSASKPKKATFDIVDHNTLTFYDDGGCVESNYVAISPQVAGAVSVTSSKSWCQVVDKTDSGFRVECDKNPNNDSRTAKLAVIDRMNDCETYITVTQFGKQYKLEVNKNKPIEIEGKGGDLFVEVSTQDNFKVEGLPKWCKLGTVAYNGFYLSTEPNDGDAVRQKTILVKTSHKKVEVLVSQSPKSPEAEINNIVVSEKGVGKDMAMNISFTLNVQNMKDKMCKAVVYFYDSEGKPLNSGTQTYDGNSTLNVSRVFTPSSKDYTKTLELSMPCSRVDPSGKGKEVLYSIVIFDKSSEKSSSIGKTREKIYMEIPAMPYLKCSDVYFNYNGGEKRCEVTGNVYDYTIESHEKWIYTTKTPGGFMLKCDKNKNEDYRYGTIIICSTDNGCSTEVRVSQGGKERGLPWYKGRFSLGIDLAADANYNMKGIGSKENSELFYCWGGGLMLRIGRVCWGDYYLTDMVNVTLGARYMKYSYNYMTEKGDLGDYVVFPVNLKLNTFKLGDKCRFYIGVGYEYGMALKDAPTFMDWNAGIGLNSRHIDWNIFFKQYFKTEDSGKFYFDDHYKNHIGTSLTFYF